LEREPVRKELEPRREAINRFYRILDELEDFFDRGFFLSFIGKIIVDEKKVYSLLNELRSLTPEGMKVGNKASQSVEVPQPPPLAAPLQVEASDLIRTAHEEVQRVREGADRYADEVLGQLEEKLISILSVVQKGREVIKERL